jgi:Spy/CpxP family protein refolding chaperone
MTRYSLLSFAAIIFLYGLSCPAEQPLQQPVPPSPAAPMSAPAPMPRPEGPHKVHGGEYPPMRAGGPGMRSETRIAPPGMWWKNPDLVQKLSLSADQQKRMDDIFQQSRLQLIDLKANVEKQEVMLEPMLAANPPDTNKVLSQIDRVASARAELEKANARMLLGIRGVLSTDQWTKLQAQRRDNQRFRFREGVGGGPPHGPGGPDFDPGRPRPDSLLLPLGRPGRPNFAPPGPLSMLHPPSLPESPPFLTGELPSANAADLEVPPPPSPDIDLDR